MPNIAYKEFHFHATPKIWEIESRLEEMGKGKSRSQRKKTKSPFPPPR